MKNLFLLLTVFFGASNAHAFGQARDTINTYIEEFEPTAKASKEFYDGLQNYYWKFAGLKFHLKINPDTKKPSFTFKITFRKATEKISQVSKATGKVILLKTIPAEEVVFNSLEEILADPRIAESDKKMIRATYLPKLREFQSNLDKQAIEVSETIKNRKARGVNLNSSDYFVSEMKGKVKGPLQQLTNGIPNVILVID
jgi:hypothetical protein